MITGIHFVIKWMPEKSMFIGKINNSVNWYWVEDGWFYDKMYVGTIYDNPELLKGDEE